MGSSIGMDVLDRLFAPHGASAYFRRLRGTPPAPTGGAVGPAETRRPATSTRPARPRPSGAGATTRPRKGPRPGAGATPSSGVAPARGAATSPAAVEVGEASPAHLVTFAASGREATAAGTLLETAEAAGLTPPFRCRRGICGTCTTTKLGGTVVDLRTGETSDAAGPIRLCVSEARGEVCLDL